MASTTRIPLAYLLVLLLSFIQLIASEETVTFTKTNYITPSCFQQGINTALENNSQSLTTGIPIVFVYGNRDDDEQQGDSSHQGNDAQQSNSQVINGAQEVTQGGNPTQLGTTNSDNQQTQQTQKSQEVIVTSSRVSYAVSTDSTETATITTCSGNLCSISVSTKVVPHTYSTDAVVTYTTTGSKVEKSDAQLSAGKEQTKSTRSTEYDFQTETEDSTAEAIISKVAKTTTRTIFEATVTPTTTYEGETSFEYITSTKKNPLVTKSAISKSLTKTIDTSKFTDITINDTDSKSNNSKYSNSTQSSISAYGSNNHTNSVPITSTINLSEESNQAQSVPVTKASQSPYYSYYNTSSTVRSSSIASSAIPSSSQAATNGSNSSNSSAVTTSILSNGSSIVISSAVSSGTLTSSQSEISSSSSTSSSASSSASSLLGSKASDNGYSGDLFDAISTESPLSVFSKKELPLSIPSGVDNDGVPYETNKFYSNLFLGEQTDMIWSYPYGMLWKTQDYYGFGVQHTNASDRVFGSDDTNNEGVASYYFNPIGNAELIFSSTSFSKSSNHMSVSNMRSMSALVQLSESSTIGSDYIDIPIVQGMGLVTAIYNGDLVPMLNSLMGVEELTVETSSALDKNMSKYRATLVNGVEWLIYVTVPSDSTNFNLTAESPYKIKGSTAIDGLIIQIAVAPDSSSAEGYYDEAAGMYATDASVEGSVSGGTSAEYKFAYTTKGSSSSGKTMVFALPHHVESLTSTTKECSTGIKLTSTSKGDMYGYLTNELVMSEALETGILFLPWVQNMGSDLSYTSEQLTLLAKSANEELAVDIKETVASMDSMYYSGKVIDKYAYILLVVSDIIKDEDVTNSTLEAMKDAFEPFINNKQYYPLMYDTKFGGVTSSASQGGDTGVEFGAAYYNDHHFHYGYFVHAAAVVGYVDKKLGGTWAEDNKEWVNSLIRDVANPTEDDSYFPVSRMFDWFAGHSWASGLFASGDGNNEESSSEDYNFAYGMKLWGNVSGDNSMESRGDLMLAIMSRAMNKYFYYKNDNDVEPSEIIANKVSGILFDNKVAYTTYFGTPADHPEYVHGIHMMPITPASSLIRTPSYVKEEWDDQISTFIDDVDSGWTGILRLNEALYDASSSYKFFSSDNWSSTYLDNGQSRTWGLAFSGGISNAT